MTPEQQKKHEDITKFICAELKKSLMLEHGNLSAQTDMTTDITVDSLAIMDLVFSLEENFDVSVPLNALADVRTIGELADLIQKIQK